MYCDAIYYDSLQRHRNLLTMLSSLRVYEKGNLIYLEQ